MTYDFVFIICKCLNNNIYESFESSLANSLSIMENKFNDTFGNNTENEFELNKNINMNNKNIKNSNLLDTNELNIKGTKVTNSNDGINMNKKDIKNTNWISTDWMTVKNEASVNKSMYVGNDICVGKRCYKKENNPVNRYSQKAYMPSGSDVRYFDRLGWIGCPHGEYIQSFRLIADHTHHNGHHDKKMEIQCVPLFRHK